MIPQLKDRIGSVIHTHYPADRDLGIQITDQEADIETGVVTIRLPFPISCGKSSKKSRFALENQSSSITSPGVSARFSLANFRTMVASARQRGRRARRASCGAAYQ